MEQGSDPTGRSVDVFRRDNGTYGLTSDGDSVGTIERSGREAVKFGGAQWFSPDSAVADREEEE